MITIQATIEWQAGTPGTHARAGMHKLVMDESKAMGGDDLGPNPMQCLLAGMGGCLIGIGRMVAKEKGLAIDHIRCRAEGHVNPEGMSGNDPSVRPGCQDIRIVVEVKSKESPEAIREWLAVVEKRCPVSDTVSGATPVTVELKV